MSKEIRIGDTVRLKSGSPDLHVIAQDSRNLVVSWHNGTDTELALFPVVSVRKTQNSN